MSFTYAFSAQLFGVAQPIPVEGIELIPSVLFLGREASGWRAANRKGPRNIRRNRSRHVGVNAEQSRRLLQGHHLRNGIAPVATLRHVLRVAETLHQRRPRLGDANGIPSR